MKINLEINNVTDSPIGEGFLKMVAEKTFAELSYSFLQDREVEISLALVAKEEIRKINKEYRKHNSATDILSFPEYENIRQIKKTVEKKTDSQLFLGELILCYDDIWEYAGKENIKIEKELAKVVSHGLLHLLGFEHGKKMFALQEKVADEIKK